MAIQAILIILSVFMLNIAADYKRYSESRITIFSFNFFIQQSLIIASIVLIIIAVKAY